MSRRSNERPPVARSRRSVRQGRAGRRSTSTGLLLLFIGVGVGAAAFFFLNHWSGAVGGIDRPVVVVSPETAPAETSPEDVARALRGFGPVVPLEERPTNWGAMCRSSPPGADDPSRRRIEPLEWHRLVHAARKRGANDVGRLKAIRDLAEQYSVIRRAKVLRVSPAEDGAARVFCRERPSIEETHEFTTDRDSYTVRLGGEKWSIYVRPAMTDVIETWQRWDELSWLVVPTVGDSLYAVHLPELPSSALDVQRTAGSGAEWPVFEEGDRTLLQWLKDFRAAKESREWDRAWALVERANGKALPALAEVNGSESGNYSRVVCTLTEDFDDHFHGGGWTGRVEARADDELCEAVERGDRVVVAGFVSVDATSADTLKYGSNAWAKITWRLWRRRQ